jgi:UDPglucose 6-dehydrogenase
MKSISIIGYGNLGKNTHRLFINAHIYDPLLKLGSKEEVNGSQYAFICVPTPSLPDGSLDTSIVEEVVGWLEASIIIIQSTVPVGTTDRLCKETGKRIIFQPIYFGSETPNHIYSNPHTVPWITLGGLPKDVSDVAALYKVVLPLLDIRICQTNSRTAELAKFMENAYLATKVTFCNEFYDIAQALGIDYNELREVWLQDERMGRDHTLVYPDKRGFGGPCLPKDTLGIITVALENSTNPELLRAVVSANERMRQPSI